MIRHIDFVRLCAALAIASYGPTRLSGQNTTIQIGTTSIQGPVKRLGINLGGQTSYDSAQMVKDHLFANPGFEGEIYQSIIRCV